MSDHRRIARVRVAELLVLELVSTRAQIRAAHVIEGVPAGARLVDALVQEGVLELIFEHPSFEHVPEGCTVPDITVVVKSGAQEQS